MQALRERQRAILSDLTGPDALETRPWRIHRNTIWRGLIDALGDAYPVFKRVVGAEFFEMIAREFIARHPPATASLILYGEDFPDFAKAHSALAEVPYAADLARLERAWLESYHAADAATLSAADAAPHDPQDLMASSFDLHPACRLIRSDYPIDVIWELHQRDEFPEAPIVPERAAQIIVCRPDFDVIVESLTEPCFEFLNALKQGASLEHGLSRAGGVPQALPHLQRAITLRLLRSIRKEGLTDGPHNGTVAPH